MSPKNFHFEKVPPQKKEKKKFPGDIDAAGSGPHFEKHCLEKLLPIYTTSYVKDCSLHQFYNSEKLETDLKFISKIDIQLIVYLYK